MISAVSIPLQNRQLLSCRKPALAPRRPRAVFATHASLQDPYTTLGVDIDADERAVKKAFRKMALKHHPDVAKEGGAEVKFLKLTEAYEFIMRKLKGGNDYDDHFEKTEDSWDFHDWYWQFRIKRSWGKKAQKQYGDEVEGEEQEGPQQRAYEPGFKTKESKQVLQSQLAGLRQRAAARAYRASIDSSMEESMEESDSDCEDFPYPQFHRRAPKEALASASSQPAAAASSVVEADSPQAPPAAPPSPPKVQVNIRTGSQNQWGEWDLSSFDYGDDVMTTASFDDLFGAQGQEHDAFHKRHFRKTQSAPASVHAAAAASAAAPSADVTTTAHDASFASSLGGDFDFDTTSDCAAAGASSGHGFSQQFKQRPRFAASQDRRDAVMHQLAGLKRKAAFVKQHA